MFQGPSSAHIRQHLLAKAMIALSWDSPACKVSMSFAAAQRRNECKVETGHIVA
jgi:hypothetical protein